MFLDRDKLGEKNVRRPAVYRSDAASWGKNDIPNRLKRNFFIFPGPAIVISINDIYGQMLIGRFRFRNFRRQHKGLKTLTKTAIALWQHAKTNCFQRRRSFTTFLTCVN